MTLTTIFCEVDEFCKYFEKEFDKKLLLGNKKRARKGKMLPCLFKYIRKLVLTNIF